MICVVCHQPGECYGRGNTQCCCTSHSVLLAKFNGNHELAHQEYLRLREIEKITDRFIYGRMKDGNCNQ
jgi:hypothetical protein